MILLGIALSFSTKPTSERLLQIFSWVFQFIIFVLLGTHIGLGLLKEIAKRRSDLKIIVMSATLDARKFQQYFSTRSDRSVAPLFKVPGRTFPVEVTNIPNSLRAYH